jgi:hypothetical protein
MISDREEVKGKRQGGKVIGNERRFRVKYHVACTLYYPIAFSARSSIFSVGTMGKIY